MKFARRAGRRWSLADLIDFEALLATTDARMLARDRPVFLRDIRPRIAGADATVQRRDGLHDWLEKRRQADPPDAGRLWGLGFGLARLALSVAMFVTGVALIVGLCAGPGQAVHVVVFLAMTLALPWLIFFALLILRRFAPALAVLPVGWLFKLGRHLKSTTAESIPIETLRARLLESRAPRRAVGASVGELLQTGALGFNVGLVLAFLACLLVFDVRFYWEATPETGGLVESSVAAIGAPWAAIWPAAVPDTGQIEASRARLEQGERRLSVPADSNAAWWRFLLMSLLVWGVLPRLALLGIHRLGVRRAMAGLDFQAPRHRQVWRALAGVERGVVAEPAADGALVLDVGGAGVSLAAVRGFLLRGLRLNPEALERVSVLDDAAEAAADRALACRSMSVVLFVSDWSLSPRQVSTLHARVRRSSGARPAMIWVVYGGSADQPMAPDADRLARWTRFIDGLRDPATEITGYDGAR